MAAEGDDDVGDHAPASPSWLDRVSVAWAGPVLAASTLALAGGYLAGRIDLNRALDSIARVESDNAQLAEQFERFRLPGDRFTAADGARHERRIQLLEDQCARCAESRAEVMVRLRTIEEAQRDLCSRIQTCAHQHGGPGVVIPTPKGTRP